MTPSLSSFWVTSGCYSRLLYWLPSTVSHKGWLCGSHSLPVFAYMDFTERVTQSEWHNEISVEAWWRHDSLIELAKQSALSWSFFPVGVYSWWQHRFELWKLTIITTKPFGQRGKGEKKEENRAKKKKCTHLTNTELFRVWIQILLISIGHSLFSLMHRSR